jgi:hypothetical protein
MTTLSLPAAIFGKEIHKGPVPQDFRVLLAHSLFDVEKLNRLGWLGQKFAWANTGASDPFAPCYGLCHVGPGACFIICFRDAGLDDQGRPHTLRMEVALIEGDELETHKDRLFLLLCAAAWPDSPIILSPEPTVTLTFPGHEPSTAPVPRKIKAGTLEIQIVGEPDTFCFSDEDGCCTSPAPDYSDSKKTLPRPDMRPREIQGKPANIEGVRSPRSLIIGFVAGLLTSGLLTSLLLSVSQKSAFGPDKKERLQKWEQAAHSAKIDNPEKLAGYLNSCQEVCSFYQKDNPKDVLLYIHELRKALAAKAKQIQGLGDELKSLGANPPFPSEQTGLNRDG